MRIFRFDPQVAVPISQFGSRFKIGPLTDAGSHVRVQILHLPAGGLIGRHAATSAQLFGVVAGSGWVSGADGRRRPLRAGFAALWAEDEEHEAGTDSGLTAVSIEGDFATIAWPMNEEVVVVDYDQAWPEWFERIRARVWPAVQDVAVRIDHVGSTAVPGLAAKPIIDLDIVVSSEEDVRPAIVRLREIGYSWRGNLDIEGREAFTTPRDSDLPDHHLYLVVDNNKAHQDHWLLRDLLRDDADARRRYAELKRRNAEVADGDIEFYVAAKAKLVAELLTRARAERGLPPATYWEPDIT